MRSSQLVRHAPFTAEHLSALSPSLFVVSSRRFPVEEDVEGEPDAWDLLEQAMIIVPVRRHTQIHARIRSLWEVWDFNGPGLKRIPDQRNGVRPASSSANPPDPYSVQPLWYHFASTRSLYLELGTVDVSFANCKGVEHKHGDGGLAFCLSRGDAWCSYLLSAFFHCMVFFSGFAMVSFFLFLAHYHLDMAAFNL